MSALAADAPLLQTMAESEVTKAFAQQRVFEVLNIELLND